MAQPIITTSLVRLDAEFGPTPADVISSLTSIVSNAGRTEHAETLFADAMAREKNLVLASPVGLPSPIVDPNLFTPPLLLLSGSKKEWILGLPMALLPLFS